MSTPTTWAVYVPDWPCTVTVMLVDPVTTWLLVRISPVGLMSMPEPAAWLDPSTVLMSTIAGLTLAAIAAASPLDEPVPGVAGVIGVVGVMGEGVCVVDWAIWCEVTARARLHPIPAPAAAATTAIRTT